MSNKDSLLHSESEDFGKNWLVSLLFWVYVYVIASSGSKIFIQTFGLKLIWKGSWERLCLSNLLSEGLVKW